MWGSCVPTSGLRPHPRPAASLTPPTRERRVSAGGRGQGSGAGLPGFPASRQVPPTPPPLAGGVGGWSDARMHTQGWARVPPGLSNCLRCEQGGPAGRPGSSRSASSPSALRLSTHGPPAGQAGFLHPRCCRSQGPCVRSLRSWAPAAGLGDSCVFLSALLRWRFDTALLCLNDQQLEIYVQSPCWVNTSLALCP